MKPSRTAQRHALRRRASTQSVVSGGITSFNVEHSTIGSDAATTVTFAASAGHPAHPIDLRGLDLFVAIREPFAKSFAMAAAKKKTPLTRKAFWENASALLRFLGEVGEFAIRPEDVNDNLLPRFVNWLNRSDNGKILAIPTRQGNYYAAREVLITGHRAGLFGHAGLEYEYPKNPWVGQRATPSRKKRFALADEMTKVLRRCLSEAIETMSRLQPLLDALNREEATSPVVQQALRFRQELLCSNAQCPSFKLKSIFDRNVDDATRRSALALILPSALDLVPFFILLTHYSAFNPSTLFFLRVDSIRRYRMGDARWIVISSYKSRNESDQTVTFAVDDAAGNPERLLTFLEQWTATVREALGSDYLWVRAGEERLLQPNKLQARGSPGVNLQIQYWLRTRRLPDINLASIRKGILDLVHLQTGGDREAVRAAGGQRSPAVVDEYYISDRGRRAERASLASSVSHMERWVTSDGRVDARLLPDKSDRTAATPGWSCLDNLASEMPNQRLGRPCTAYGMCPVCPLSRVDVHSPRSCGYLHLLLDRVDEEIRTAFAGDPVRIYGIWSPVRHRLIEFWLPLFDQKTRDKAKLLDLPPIPTIE